MEPGTGTGNEDTVKQRTSEPSRSAWSPCQLPPPPVHSGSLITKDAWTDALAHAMDIAGYYVTQTRSDKIDDGAFITYTLFSQMNTHRA
jgi:hypothetical protein